MRRVRNGCVVYVCEFFDLFVYVIVWFLCLWVTPFPSLLQWLESETFFSNQVGGREKHYYFVSKICMDFMELFEQRGNYSSHHGLISVGVLGKINYVNFFYPSRCEINFSHNKDWFHHCCSLTVLISFSDKLLCSS